jgi:beta-galactosidase
MLLSISRKRFLKKLSLVSFLFVSFVASAQRRIENFNKDWKFYLGDDSTAREANYNDTKWRTLNLPHDWSIEGSFSDKYPTTPNQGALPAGIGWYRKSFVLPMSAKGQRFYIEFDGIYRNSEVWINGHYLGKRANGYISFRYELTPYLKIGAAKNVIAVKADNSAQPSSRWYTGSGIYRNVRLVSTNKIAVDAAETYINTKVLSGDKGETTDGGNLLPGQQAALINIKETVTAAIDKRATVSIVRSIYSDKGKLVSTATQQRAIINGGDVNLSTSFVIYKPELWSVQKPSLYKLVTSIVQNGKVIDKATTSFGIRYFHMDVVKGFSLNGKPLKIFGVCNHHDLGALGAAVNKRAIERQLEILKAMGCNAIRTAHNPPAPELLELCDKMGFIVMDEAFDMWKRKKNKQDYSVDFNQWHKQDLEDMIRRDRNHPSIIFWSIGNEIPEQFDSSGITIARELVNIVKSLDSSRLITSALTENVPEKNNIYKSGALDVLGFNYKLKDYPQLPLRFPGQKFLATETSSALATRGHYDMPSDSIRLWPPDSKSKFATGNPDLTVSAYDNTYAYWGSTHEDGWNAVKKYDFMSGIFVWSGFDFLGEPVPYPWPARSSYYGVIDLAGFPKDTYYMYQSEWTNKPMLHVFPHWNWQPGKAIDVWAYYNKADEVELFLNGKLLGTKRKQGDSLHVMWRVNFEPGTLKAVSRLNGKTVLTKEIKTAGKPAKIELLADRKNIKADGEDLSFVTVKILDAQGNVVPDADNLVNFKTIGTGFIAGVDNGLQTSMEPFKATYRKAFNGLCLAIIQSKEQAGKIILEAKSKGLRPASIVINVVK